MTHNANQRITFLWVPSHFGVKGNEEADHFANQATNKDHIDCDVEPSIKQVSNKTARLLHSKYMNEIENIVPNSNTLQHYQRITQTHTVDYRKIKNRRTQTTIARIRMGYPYIWELSGSGDMDFAKCRICKQDNAHTLHHYITECPKTTHF